MIGRRSFPCGEAYFQRRTVSFREGYLFVAPFWPHGICQIRSWDLQSLICRRFGNGYWWVLQAFAPMGLSHLRSKGTFNGENWAIYSIWWKLFWFIHVDWRNFSSNSQRVVVKKTLLTCSKMFKSGFFRKVFNSFLFRSKHQRWIVAL